jgi:hypothetical protein
MDRKLATATSVCASGNYRTHTIRVAVCAVLCCLFLICPACLSKSEGTCERAISWLPPKADTTFFVGDFDGANSKSLSLLSQLEVNLLLVPLSVFPVNKLLFSDHSIIECCVASFTSIERGNDSWPYESSYVFVLNPKKHEKWGHEFELIEECSKQRERLGTVSIFKLQLDATDEVDDSLPVQLSGKNPVFFCSEKEDGVILVSTSKVALKSMLDRERSTRETSIQGSTRSAELRYVDKLATAWAIHNFKTPNLGLAWINPLSSAKNVRVPKDPLAIGVVLSADQNCAKLTYLFGSADAEMKYVNWRAKIKLEGLDVKRLDNRATLLTLPSPNLEGVDSPQHTHFYAAVDLIMNLLGQFVFR